MGTIETFMYFYVAIILGLSLAPFIFIAVTRNNAETSNHVETSNNTVTRIIWSTCSTCWRCSRWSLQHKHPNEIPLLQEMNDINL